MSLKILTIVGARPQFIKAAAVSREIRVNNSRDIKEVILHTGQHFDKNMSESFFENLEIPHPDYNLNVAGGSHGDMTARMLSGIEEILLKEKPSWVLIYGDTNSTLAGALAACKMHIPLAHVEAGLRSFNKRMPEEINRILSDHVSSLLFCPSEIAVQNLKNEGLTKNVHNVGDVMYDMALHYSKDRPKENVILENLGIDEGHYVLATCHRAENTDDKGRFENILSALHEISSKIPVIFPLHPRTRKLIEEHSLSSYLSPIKVVAPLSYFEMLYLEKNAHVIVTDSGGVQKEAYFFHVPCVTIRDETEWAETVTVGANHLAGTSREKILELTLKGERGSWATTDIYGEGNASHKIIKIIRS